MMKRIKFVLRDLKATKALAFFLIENCPTPVTFLLSGKLGAGKTQFVKFLGEKLQVSQPIISPTFFKMCLYKSLNGKKIAHFDGYHLKPESDLSQFEDFFDYDYVIIEWPEVFIKHLSIDNQVHLELNIVDSQKRLINISASDKLLKTINLWKTNYEKV